MNQTPYNPQQNNVPPQQGYMPPPPNQQPLYSPYTPNNAAPLSVGQYILIFIIMAIPIVNIVMLFVWAFGDANANKKNFAKAALILMLISIILGIIMSIVFGSIFSSLLNFTIQNSF